MTFPEDGPAEDDAFACSSTSSASSAAVAPQLSGLKNQLRKRQPDFSEKRYGFGSFLSFVKAGPGAAACSRWTGTTTAGDYRLHIERLTGGVNRAVTRPPPKLGRIGVVRTP